MKWILLSLLLTGCADLPVRGQSDAEACQWVCTQRLERCLGAGKRVSRCFWGLDGCLKSLCSMEY